MRKLLAVSALATVVGCQAIVGVEDREVDPIKGGCALPTTGGASVRFGNLYASDAAVDVCVRSSGGEYGRPVLRGGGTACKAGFKYTDMSAPFAVPAGKIDVKVVPAGSTCKVAALAETKGIEAPAGSTTTLLRMGNAKLKDTVRAYRETTERAPSGTTRTRVIHASPGTPALDFGITKSARLPVDLSDVWLKQPLAFGEATSKDSTFSLGKPDANGYVDLPGTKLNLAAAPAGQKRAILVAELPAVEGGRTIIAIGDPAQPFFPVRALVCNDLDVVEGKTSCELSALGTLSVDSFNAYLYGPFAFDETERWPYVRDAIVGRTEGDVMCVTALSRRAQQDEVIAKSKERGTWPYSIQYTSTLDTPATAPADQTGNVPKPYTIAACKGSNDPAKVEAALKCVENQCSTTGTPDGILKGGSGCISEKCAAEFIPFIVGTKEEKRCFNCMVIATVSDVTHKEVREQCLTDTRDYKAFAGATTSMVLSKFPLRNPETYVLPSTSYQRVVHYAELEIEKDKYIDYYCAELSAAFGELVPYHGHYAVEGMGDPWMQEQVWQAKNVIQYVKKKSGTKPAIIAGEWAASRTYKSADGKTLIDEQNPQVYDVLDAGLIPAVPTPYVPFCTECAAPVNPYNGDKNILQFKAYVWNMAPTSGVEIGKFFTEFPVPVGGEKRPLTDRWGYNTRVLRP